MLKRIIVEAVGARGGGGLRQLAPFLTHLSYALPPNVTLEVYAIPEVADELPPLPRTKVRRVRAPQGISLRRLALDLLWLPMRSMRRGTVMLSPLNLGPMWVRGHHIVYQRDIRFFEGSAELGFSDRLKSRWARRMVRKADAVVTPSAAIAELVRRQRSDGIHIIPHGADDAIESPQVAPAKYAAARAWSDAPGIKLLAVSRFNNANKDLRTQLEAIRILGQRDTPVSWAATVSSDDEGDDSVELGALAEQLGISDRVTFLGICDRSTITWLYRAADLNISSSRMESFGFPLIEAAIEGCRSVCSDIPASRELMGAEAVGYFPPGDAAALADLIASSARVGRLQPAVVGAFRNRYSWAEHARRVTALLMDLMRAGAE